MRRLRYLIGLLRETAEFASSNKAWWLVPMVVILIAVGAIIWAGGGALPLIYTLF